MLNAATLLRSPSAKIIAQVQNEIMAEVPDLPMPANPNEPGSDEPPNYDMKLATSVTARVSHGGPELLHHDIPSARRLEEVILTQRREICREITTEHRIALGCGNLASVLHKASPSRELAVNLAFAASREQDLVVDLKNNIFLAQLALRLNDDVDPDLSYRDVSEQLFGTILARQDEWLHADARLLEHHVANPAVIADIAGAFVALPLMIVHATSFREAIELSLTTHYLEAPDHLSVELATFRQTRQQLFATHVCPRLGLSPSGQLTKFIKYYHLLGQLEERFLRDGLLRNIHYRWYDWLTGREHHDLHVLAERLCVLSGAAACATQAAVLEPMDSATSCSRARTYFEMAAGLIELMITHRETEGAPHIASESWTSSNLQMLLAFNLAQAQECHFKTQIVERQGSALPWPKAQEAAAVAHAYGRVREALTSDPLSRGLWPDEWIGTVYAKYKEYQGLADLLYVQHLYQDDHSDPNELPMLHTRLHRAARSLKLALRVCQDDPEHRLAMLQTRIEHDLRAVNQLLAEEKVGALDYDMLRALSPVTPTADRWAQPICLPALTKPANLWRRLGPAHFFNARCPLTDRRRCKLLKSTPEQSFGLVLEGGRPCRVSEIVPGSPADVGGVTAGTYVLAVNRTDVRSWRHGQVVKILQQATKGVLLTIVENAVLDEAILAGSPPREFLEDGSEVDSVDSEDLKDIIDSAFDLQEDVGKEQTGLTPEMVSVLHDEVDKGLVTHPTLVHQGSI
ncbi:uncharacterized protein MONBRDRAFT_13006 [Monosiga brevicollis MX1]|uniref:PDZ domain-containing protein n=1 Tax=Monosiga brevicollis TaxID=81824 RepID=A9VE04_MONBE|nr:uncharacterized protein MONBRDRAFT_13006 [Monosiga brevicollis MX1]EDQ84224.1 predicted protein [Monosiga brevicollis MX1]|eukprot:XP_001750948.1 hypothetical protein [Monosiga brevicollis MX1]